MKKINIDYSNVLGFLREEEIYDFQAKVIDCHNMLHYGMGVGNDYLGWVKVPNDYDREEFNRIKITAQKIREESDVFIIIGIGGSYLGAKAAIEMLNHRFYNELEEKKPKIYFLGQNISQNYLSNLLEIIEGKRVSINVISKSGTTIEPAIAFRILKKYMEEIYGQDANKRIYITTDKTKGVLKALADNEGYEQFAIPDDIGGRYSVLTSVGLLPMAVSGIDIDEVMKGAGASFDDLSDYNLNSNNGYKYAVIRNLLYNKGKTIEIMASYEPNLLYFGEWLKQLFGESEGKDKKGIFPSYLTYTTDLHSMGQYVQDGRRDIFETILNVKSLGNDIIIDTIDDDLDGLNYLSGKTMDYINKKAMEGTIIAHVKGGVPNIIVNIPEISPYYFGYMAYFFQKVCGLSGYLLGVNPFDQPGVEEYKSSMYKLLGKK